MGECERDNPKGRSKNGDIISMAKESCPLGTALNRRFRSFYLLTSRPTKAFLACEQYNLNPKISL